jgi:hypothetical protein
MEEPISTTNTYDILRADRIVETTRKLSHRISERFPDSGLSRVGDELLAVSEQAALTADWIDKPHIWLRIGIALCVIVLVTVVVSLFSSLQMQIRVRSLSEFLQAMESGINDIIFLSLAGYFLFSWESRIKRNRTLKSIHKLRSLAHIIDMHQLTKDPERLMTPADDTASSPERKMTAFELTRYLDYCSEMLAIISKIAAVYIEHFEDPGTLTAVNDIEDLTSGLSRKIWQKIMILDRISSSGTP